MPGDPGVTVVTNSRVFYTTREAAGASDARHSLRPLISWGGTLMAKLAWLRGEIAESRLTSLRAKRRSHPFFSVANKLNCFAEPVIGRAFARPVGSQSRSVLWLF